MMDIELPQSRHFDLQRLADFAAWQHDQFFATNLRFLMKRDRAQSSGIN
jgi:hypothetical protein